MTSEINRDDFSCLKSSVSAFLKLLYDLHTLLVFWCATFNILWIFLCTTVAVEGAVLLVDWPSACVSVTCLFPSQCVYCELFQWIRSGYCITQKIIRQYQGMPLGIRFRTEKKLCVKWFSFVLQNWIMIWVFHGFMSCLSQ